MMRGWVEVRARLDRTVEGDPRARRSDEAQEREE
jgi:hypothetical protein